MADVALSGNSWCRYADDGLIHCGSKQQAEKLLNKLAKRFQECGLELHPEKTKIVYCKNSERQANHETAQFDFLGYNVQSAKST